MFASHANDTRCDAGAEVTIERDGEFGLRAVALDDPCDWRQADERRVDQLVAVATGPRLINQCLQPLLEWRRLRLRCTRWRLLRDQEDRREKQSSASHEKRAGEILAPPGAGPTIAFVPLRIDQIASRSRRYA